MGLSYLHILVWVLKCLQMSNKQEWWNGAACFVIRVHSFGLLDKLKDLINPHWQQRHKLHLHLRWQWSEQSSGRLQHKSFWYDRAVQNLQTKSYMYYSKRFHSWYQHSSGASGKVPKHNVTWCTFVHRSTGEYEGAFDGGGTLPVARGVSAELPVPTKPKRVHFPRGGREGQCVLPCGCTQLRNFLAE